GAVADTEANIHVGDDGQATVQPLGLSVQARRLPRTLATSVADLLNEASQSVNCSPMDDPPDRPTDHVRVAPPTLDRPRGLPVADAADDDDWVRPAPELLVRVLGAPRIDEYTGLGRIELNLVTFLACNGGYASESQLINAVWNGRAIERATLWNRISKARA